MSYLHDFYIDEFTLYHAPTSVLAWCWLTPDGSHLPSTVLGRWWLHAWWVILVTALHHKYTVRTT